MTELAYLVDLPAGYVARFTARVTALPPGGIVLDRTYFYPTGGGQPADHGTLRTGATTLDVSDVVKVGTSVLHRVHGGPRTPPELSIGSELTGAIDWERRHQHMRLHTAQHLASARLFARTGLRTRRANLQGVRATIDLESDAPPRAIDDLSEDLAGAQRAPRAVRIRQVPRAEWDANPAAPRAGLVPLPAAVDPVRVIEIDGEDSCPCGGTHLRSTAEMGEVRVESSPPGATGVRRIAFTLVRPGSTTPPG